MVVDFLPMSSVNLAIPDFCSLISDFCTLTPALIYASPGAASSQLGAWFRK
jgi:hypothetical protein